MLYEVITLKRAFIDEAVFPRLQISQFESSKRRAVQGGDMVPDRREHPPYLMIAPLDDLKPHMGRT